MGVTTGDGVDLHLRLRTAHAGSDAGQHLKRVRAVATRCGHRETQIHLGGAEGTDGVRRHANDGVRLAPNRQRCADDPRVAGKSSTPKRVRDHGCQRAPRDVIAAREQSAAHRRYAERREELRADAACANRLGCIGRHQRVATGTDDVENRQRREGASLRGEREVVVHRKAAAAAKWRPPSHLDDVVGPLERQGPQQERVHDGEDRRVGADSQPEDKGGRQRKDWCPS